MFEKYCLVGEDNCYKAEYSTLEDAKKAAQKLPKYYDTDKFMIWHVVYDENADIVDTWPLFDESNC